MGHARGLPAVVPRAPAAFLDPRLTCPPSKATILGIPAGY